MLLDFYNHIMIMSVVGGGLYLILKLLSVVTFRYFTAAWHYFSCLVLSTFFLIPYYALLSRFDLNFIPKVDELVLLPQTLLNPSSPIKSAAKKVAVSPGENYALYSCLEFIPYLLMAGTVIFTVIIIVQNYKLNRRIFKACRLAADPEILETFAKCKQELGIRKEIPVYISAYINTPFLSGIFSPRIVLPNIGFQAEELRYIFIHELTHWKNHDAWLKSLMLFINVVHWFNPLAYMARRDIDRLGEAFCDESVTRSMNQEERRRYCELILSVLWHVAEPNNICSAFSDKRDIERRISMIMKAEKCKKWVRMFAVAMTLALAVTGTAAAYAATAGGAEGILDSSAPISANVLSGANTGALVAEADGLTPALSEVSPKSEVYSVSKDNVPMGTVTWADTTIPYHTEMRFISSAPDGYFVIGSGITATFKFSIKGGSSENIRVAFKDRSGNTIVLFEGSASSKTVYYTPSQDTEGNFYVWNKGVANITLTNISLSY
ncbi:MAG: M56 family metallopeptidase [Syntrophomonadaceae bacterium]|jgi:beta-lactamase regulating signal transducer with metallopeptidase domain